MLIKPKNRYQAFGIHLVISAIIFLILAAIIIFLWYPGFLFQKDGGWQGIRLIAGIDFIIGPTLTLIIYKVGKRGLKFDLILIALIQFACLGYGVWIVHNERPIAVIFADGEFLVKSELAIKWHDVDVNDIYKMDSRVPAWIYIDLPEGEQERKSVLKNQIKAGLIYIQTQRYRPYKQNLDKIMKEAIDPAMLEPDIVEQMSTRGKMFHYSTRYAYGYIEIDMDTGEVIKVY